MQFSNLLPVAVDLAITMPDGSDSGVTLKLVGQDSKQYLEAAKRTVVLQDEIRQAKAVTVELLDKVQQDAAERIASHIVGWTGAIDEHGSQIPYSREAAIELMSNPGTLHVREQVERYASERQHFFRRGTQAA